MITEKSHSPKSSGMLIVMKSVMVHTQEFVCLAKPIPCSVVFPVYVYHKRAGVNDTLHRNKSANHTYSTPVGFNSGMWVFHFDVLVTHESPRRKIRPIKLGGSSEILDSFLMLSTKRIMIAWPSKWGQAEDSLFSKNLPTRQHTSGRSLSRARNSWASLDNLSLFSVT